MPTTPQGPRIRSLFDLNTSNRTHTKHGPEQDQSPPPTHHQAPARAATSGINPNHTYVTTNGFDHSQQPSVGKRGESPSNVLDQGTLESDIYLSPTGSSSSLDLGMLQSQAQRPATDAQLPGTNHQQAQQSLGTK